MPLDVLVPDLLLPADAPDALRAARLPALERWLARGDASRLPHRDATAALSAAFSLPGPPPLAAVTLAGDDRPQEGSWLRADPVHVRVEAASAMLRDPSILEVTREEANALVAALNGLFAEDGLVFQAPDPARWYVRVPDGEAPTTTPLDDALGRNAFALMPQGSARLRWPSILTEAQMLLASHPVNARREADGRPAINSLWFWGEGATPASLPKPYAMILADAPFPKGLATLSGARHAEVPKGFAAIDAVRADESVLLALDTLVGPRRAGDADGWLRAAQALDTDWFAEMDRALPRFERITLLLPSGRDTLAVRITPQMRWRWLRRSRPLASRA